MADREKPRRNNRGKADPQVKSKVRTKPLIKNVPPKRAKRRNHPRRRKTFRY